MPSNVTGLDTLRKFADFLGLHLANMGAYGQLMQDYEETGDADPKKYDDMMAALPTARTHAQTDMRRLLGSAAAGLYGVDEEGKVILPVEPTEDKQALNMTQPGFLDQVMALPQFFSQVLPYEAPEWSKRASERTDATERAIREGMDYPEASTPGEYFLEAGGSMLGQPPVPGGTFTKLKAPFAAAGDAVRGFLSKYGTMGKVAGRLGQAATLPPRAGIEFFGPMVEPSLGNYASGTAFGGTMRSLLGVPPEEDHGDHAEEGLSDDIQLTPEELELLDRIMKAHQGKIESPTEPETTMAKGGKIDLSKLALRTKLKNLLTDAQVQGTGKELVPLPNASPETPPLTNLPDEIRLDQIQARTLADKPDESILDTPVSRRDVLRGMGHVAASMASPVSLDPMSLLKGDDGVPLTSIAHPAAPITPKPWAVAPALNEIFSSVVHDSDDALFPYALALARKLPGGEKLADYMHEWQQWLQKTKPDMTPKEQSDWDDEAFNRGSEFEKHLDDVAKTHGVLVEHYGQEPQYSDPTMLFGHEWEAATKGEIPRESGHELWDAAKKGDTKQMKAILSWRYSPEEYDSLTHEDNLNALVKYAQAGHPQNATPEMIYEGLTDMQHDDLREEDLNGLKMRYALSSEDAKKLYDMLHGDLHAE